MTKPEVVCFTDVGQRIFQHEEDDTERTSTDSSTESIGFYKKHRGAQDVAQWQST